MFTALLATDMYGDHLLHCKRGIHRIRRHGAQAHLLEADLIKAERHPVVEPRLFGRHKERPDISALGMIKFYGYLGGYKET